MSAINAKVLLIHSTKNLICLQNWWSLLPFCSDIKVLGSGKPCGSAIFRLSNSSFSLSVFINLKCIRVIAIQTKNIDSFQIVTRRNWYNYIVNLSGIVFKYLVVDTPHNSLYSFMWFEYISYEKTWIGYGLIGWHR